MLGPETDGFFYLWLYITSYRYSKVSHLSVFGTKCVLFQQAYWFADSTSISIRDIIKSVISQYIIRYRLSHFLSFSNDCFVLIPLCYACWPLISLKGIFFRKWKRDSAGNLKVDYTKKYNSVYLEASFWKTAFHVQLSRTFAGALKPRDMAKSCQQAYQTD